MMGKRRRVTFWLLVCLLVTTMAYATTYVDVIALGAKILSGTVTVGNSATKLPTSPMLGRRTLAIFNVDAATRSVFIGHSGVTTANGFPLTEACPGIVIDMDGTVDIYGIVATGTNDVRVLEVK